MLTSSLPILPNPAFYLNFCHLTGNMNLCIQYVQLDEWGMKAWLKFKQKDAVAKIICLQQVVLDGGINFPVALDRQDEVTTKLKIENPSLDTSIRQDEVTAKLKTENPSLDTSISNTPVPEKVARALNAPNYIFTKA
ncbi:hypothetical protein Tco_0240946 [Tanacetum coccineum]